MIVNVSMIHTFVRMFIEFIDAILISIKNNIPWEPMEAQSNTLTELNTMEGQKIGYLRERVSLLSKTGLLFRVNLFRVSQKMARSEMENLFIKDNL